MIRPCEPMRSDVIWLPMSQNFDAIVAGSCVVDLLCRPVKLDQPLVGGKLHYTEPLLVTAGGITSNSGVTLARLGLRVGVMAFVGKDAWAPVVREMFTAEGIDTSIVLPHTTLATSTTVVAIDPSGERGFLHYGGSSNALSPAMVLDHLDVFARSKFLLLGYYSMLPELENELPAVLRKVRAAGCKTALDAGGSGGAMQPLDRILPELDVYVPSLDEAVHQTGLHDPRKIIDAYRACGAPGIVGVKLGKQGVLLSPRAGEYVSVPICTPPGPVVDTTGAGDSFYAGLLAGLIKGLSIEQAGRIGTAAAACCVTVLGGSAGGRDWNSTQRIAAGA